MNGLEVILLLGEEGGLNISAPPLPGLNKVNKQNNNFAHASPFFVHFFAVFAQLRRKNA